MSFESLLGGLGKTIDADLVEWRRKGIRGTTEEREKFRKEQFHNARGMLRLIVAMNLALGRGTSEAEILESIKEIPLSLAASQADESGFDEEEKARYVAISRDAYESLADEYRSRT